MYATKSETPISSAGEITQAVETAQKNLYVIREALNDLISKLEPVLNQQIVPSDQTTAIARESYSVLHGSLNDLLYTEEGIIERLNNTILRVVV